MATRPVARTKEVASTDDVTLEDQTIDLDKTREVGIVEPVVLLDKPLAQLAEEERFMRDMVEVHFAEAMNENETPVIEVTVNGQYFFARRGESKAIPRYMLEVLARSKVMRVRTERQVQPDGSETMTPRITYTPSYPFTVLSDPAGAKGVAWLKTILNQPG